MIDAPTITLVRAEQLIKGRDLLHDVILVYNLQEMRTIL